MADSTSPAEASDEDFQLTFNVKSNDAKHVITIAASATVLELKTTLSTSEYADLPPERQRLIYSGRVLKDTETLDNYKIKKGHTVHLVKGAASNLQSSSTTAAANLPSSSSTTTGRAPAAGASAVPTNIATGTANNPLAGLTGARYAGFHNLPGIEMFGPDGGMGPPPNQEQLLQMMENPAFLSQMNEAMNNPAVIQMLRDNPMIRNNPMARLMIDSPEFRRFMTNPDIVRAQVQMNRAMGGAAAPFGQPAPFPAPGITNNTPQTNPIPTPPNPGSTPLPPGLPNMAPQGNPFAALFGTGALGNPAATNPFAATTTTTPPQHPQTTNPTPQQPSQGQQNHLANLFATAGTAIDGQQNNAALSQAMQQIAQNPEAAQMAMQMMAALNTTNPAPGGAAQALPPGYAGGGLPNPAAFGFQGDQAGLPAQPQDNRPPEERFAEQLRQLNEMGFYEFERNVMALRRSGGSVQGAVEYLLSGL